MSDTRLQPKHIAEMAEKFSEVAEISVTIDDVSSLVNKAVRNNGSITTGKIEADKTGHWRLFYEYRSWLQAGTRELVKLVYNFPVGSISSKVTKWIPVYAFSYEALTNKLDKEDFINRRIEMKQVEDLRSSMKGIEGILDL